jgi:hypothetical protein
MVVGPYVCAVVRIWRPIGCPKCWTWTSGKHRRHSGNRWLLRILVIGIVSGGLVLPACGNGRFPMVEAIRAGIRASVLVLSKAR